MTMLAIARGFEEKFYAAEAMQMAKLAELAAAGNDLEEDDLSPILQIQDGVGVVEVRGMLTNVNSWYNQYIGMVAYDEIRKATIQAVDSGVGAMLYLYASPGGRVAGMHGCAELISSLTIPTMTFAEEYMASAALFLGIQADQVFAGDFSEVGSVGVIQTSMDYSEQMKKNGISAKRYRSGDLKQAGNPMFKLSAKEDKYLAEQVMLYAEKFYNIVSAARGIPRPMLDSLDITSGRTFIGEQAKTVGLVDGILTFDASFLKIAGLAQKNIDSRTQRTVTYGSL